MSSFERRQSSDTGLRQPGTVNQLSPVDQVPFPETNAFPVFAPRRRPEPGNANNGRTSTTPAPEPYSVAPFTNPTQPLSEQDTAAHVTRILAFNASPLVTRQLPDVRRQTGTLNSDGATTSFRQPVIIQGTGKKSSGTMRPPRGRKWVISSAIFGVMVVVFLLTGFAVVPVETGNGHAFSSLPLFGGLFQNHDANNNPNLVEQAATATAFVRQDGYDTSSNNSNNGPTQTYSGPGVTPDRFAFGQCTYWADLEYHRLTGSYVGWIGNAYQWSYGASAAGWHVSSTPHVYSIIVLQAGVQGAGGYGHVAVVEKINPDGSVLTSNMNWYANGGWDTESWWTFYPGPGVTFVWK